jgi:hypothetical protein
MMRERRKTSNSILLYQMKEYAHKSMMLIAVLVIFAHNMIPHHHFDSPVVFHHDHHEDGNSNAEDFHADQSKEDHHNPFSFAQLDDKYIPSQLVKAKIELPILYILTPAFAIHLQCYKLQPKNLFGYYRKFPPPLDHSFNLFSRPPPGC